MAGKCNVLRTVGILDGIAVDSLVGMLLRVIDGRTLGAQVGVIVGKYVGILLG